MHKSGFVNIIGSPNVGKSTLMNALVGEKLSIINAKAQTTRHRIMGIVNADDFQIVYSDTPGILNPAYKMHESMMAYVHTALKDADILLFVTDCQEKEPAVPSILDRLNKHHAPLIIVVNKIDLQKQETVSQYLDYWKEKLPRAMVVAVSALHKFNLNILFDKIIELLPEGPAYFSKDELTDKSLRFFASEIIRDKILQYYDKEIPYSCEVLIDSYKEEVNIDRIAASIIAARESQKGILIGYKGEKLKKVGTAARKELEDMLGKKVYLELYVKVEKDWRNNERMLKKFGYLN
jgi:GTP-binding protein Era